MAIDHSAAMAVFHLACAATFVWLAFQAIGRKDWFLGWALALIAMCDVARGTIAALRGFGT